MPSTQSHTAQFARLCLALSIASAGGFIFYLLGTPLPFILGAMSFCLLATQLRLPVAVPSKIRPPMSAVIGVMLGATFTPELASSIPGWIVPITGLAVFLIVSGVICVYFYRRLAGYDFRTAYFAGMPGGLMEMALLGEHYGADVRKIALAHSARILIVVFTLPFLVQLISGVELSGAPNGEPAPFTLEAVAWLAGTAVVGTMVGNVLQLPAKAILGPMLVSAIIHATGISGFRPPADIVMVAQIIIGASIGCRFAGVTPLDLVRTLMLALGSTMVLLCTTIFFALALSTMTEFSLVELMLAYSPGGLAEMGLIALAINTEVALVAAHHIVRIALVSMGAGFLARWIMATQQKQPDNPL